MYEVFICYKQNTAKDYALHLWEGLNERQITAFLDIKDIPKKFKKGTNHWRANRNNAIIECKTFLMIVTRGFESSPEIQREIALAIEKDKDLMCHRRRILSSDIPIDYAQAQKQINLEAYQQIPFDTPEELLRNALDNLLDSEQRIARAPSIEEISSKEEKHRFPLTHFTITQAVQNNPLMRRRLPNVGFNIRNAGDSPIKATVRARVFLGSKDLGLVRGGKRAGKYMGYYDGKIVWHLNPYMLVFGNFSVPKECVESKEDLRIVVSVTLKDVNGQKHTLLPVGWTFMRDKNAWFLEPTGDC